MVGQLKADIMTGFRVSQCFVHLPRQKRKLSLDAKRMETPYMP